MTTIAVVDPYGGFRESWPVGLLNAASQRSNLVLDAAVIRPVPAYNQIMLPSPAHYEACGPDSLCSMAYACGLVDDLRAAILDAISWIETAYHWSIAKFGTATEMLQGYAEHRGWTTHLDPGYAGDVSLNAYAAGKVAAIALETSYTAGTWNVLHPDAQGHIGHFEVGGCINGPGAPIPAIKQDTGSGLMNVHELIGVLTVTSAAASLAKPNPDPTVTPYRPDVVQAVQQRANRILAGQSDLQAEVNAIWQGETGR